MTRQKIAYIYAIGAVLIWSTVASAFKISLRYLECNQLLFFACIVSIVVFLIILLLQNKINLLKECTRRDYLRSALMGFLNPFLYYTVLFKAYSVLPAQEAQPLNYTWPIMLTLLSIFLLGQRIKSRNIFALIVSFIGVFVISTQGKISSLRFTNFTGVLLALTSAIIWALFWVCIIKSKRDTVVQLFLNFSFGFIYISISALIFSKIVLPEITGLLSAIYVGVFEMGIAFLIWSKALKLSGTTAKVSALIYLVPFLSLVVIYFMVGETIKCPTIVGLIFIVSGIVIQR